ncbi:uncharacterized protein LOC108709611 [Xenopus laevis]|uniref:Uncharacterized protein LOC108709611 n=2 Tax=Xenopus laevis TaxID=8355 RepID=A0A1L8H843_XENLA|nr:uncharacterized protein LOC108709611 [Xenopus laevis]OCT92235.1 hypothetical protein XELAEV_18015291mg [Xenopus laevis]
MPLCIVSGCNNKCNKETYAKAVIMHTFPKNIEDIKIWLLQTGQDFGDIEKFAQRIVDTRRNAPFRLCSDHFTPDSYIISSHNSKKTLKMDALPTLFPNSREACDTAITPALKKAKREILDNSSQSTQRIQRLPSMTDASTSTAVTVMRDVGTRTDMYHKMRNISTHTNPWHGVKNATCNTDPRHGKATVTTCTDPHLGMQDVGTMVNIRMMDAFTSTDSPSTFENKSCQWPEYEQNSVAELWKVQQDHDYSGHDYENPRAHSTPKKRPLVCKGADVQQSVPDTTSESLICSEELSKDLDYSPNSTINTNDATLHIQEKTDEDIVQERKFLVFESCLDELLLNLYCSCGLKICRTDKYVQGTFVSVNGYCYNEHKIHLWDSQPLKGSIPTGNVLSAAALLFSGGNYNRVREMASLLGMPFISQSTYYRYQRHLLFPAIDIHWQKERQSLHEQIKDTPLYFAGDGQCDSPGYNAKYCAIRYNDIAKLSMSQCDSLK